MTVTAERTKEQVAAAALRDAANLLSGGRWCTGDLYRQEETPSGHMKDKYCAVGALAVVVEPSVLQLAHEDSKGNVYSMDEIAYQVVVDSVAGRAVAEEIIKFNIETYDDFLEAGDPTDPSEYLDHVYGEGEGSESFAEVIFNFNDNANEAKEVIDIFLAAANTLDPQ